METLVTIERAIEIARQTAIINAPESITLSQAHNRILHQDLASKVDDPRFDNSAMDGWAVRSSDQERVEVGTIAAGSPPSKIGVGEATRIMTGAPMPEGADAIVLIEDGLQGKANTNFIRRRGENLNKGTVALRAGQVMTPAAISLAATMGYATIPVRVKPRVAVISTGDELVTPGEELGPESIYESNSYGLCALLEKIGCTPLLQEVVVDSLDALTTKLRKGERLLLKVRQNNSEIIKKLHALTKVNTVTEHQPAQFTIDCEPNADIQDEIAQLSLNNKWGIVELKPASMTLEDIFLKLTLEENEVQ